MTTGEFGEVGQNPSEDVLLATAIAERQMLENAQNSLIAYEVTGVMPDQTNVAYATALTAAGTLYLIKAARYSDEPVTTEQLISELFTVETIRSLHESEELEDEEAEAAQEYVRTMLTAVFDSYGKEFGMNMDEQTQRFAATYEAGVALAAENLVTPETVYTDDTLYAELVRRTIDLPAMAQKAVEATQHITAESLLNVAVAAIEAHVRAQYALSDSRGPLFVIPGYESEMAEYYASEEYAAKREQDIQNEIAREIDDMQSDPAFSEALANQLATTKKVNFAKTRGYIVRYWGEDALSTLPAEIQEALA